MKTIYIYILDTLADWELGHITAELYSGRFFKKGVGISLKMAGCTTDPIKTMGGMTIVPDCLVDDIIVSENSVLLLPGADTWSDPKHIAVISKAAELLNAGATVAAICGATIALAGTGLLDNRPHTSNGAGFLEMFVPNYKGTEFFVNKPSVADGNLITAACTGALLWTKQVIEQLGVFKEDTLEAWYDYFSTGEAGYFYALMQSLQRKD